MKEPEDVEMCSTKVSSGHVTATGETCTGLRPTVTMDRGVSSKGHIVRTCHSHRTDVHKTKTNGSPRIGERPLKAHPCLLTLLVGRNSIFYSDVVTGKLPLLQCMISHQYLPKKL